MLLNSDSNNSEVVRCELWSVLLLVKFESLSFLFLLMQATKFIFTFCLFSKALEVLPDSSYLQQRISQQDSDTQTQTKANVKTLPA